MQRSFACFHPAAQDKTALRITALRAEDDELVLLQTDQLPKHRFEVACII